MSQLLHGTTTIHTPRKHIVPTHLNLPDQVLTVWSLSLSARQLLLLLVGGGIGGTVWQHLASIGYHTLAGQVVRFLLACVPFLLVLVLACYQYAERHLEVWLIVLVRYHLHTKRYLWRSIRANAQHLYPLLSRGDEQDDEPDLKVRASLDGTHDLARSTAL
jgi:hypothetical protein